MNHKMALLVAAMVSIHCSAPEPETTTRTEPREDVDAVVVTADTITSVIPIEGNIESRRQNTISTRMMARVAAVNVDVGSRVRTGQILLSLGIDDVEADRAKAEAALRVATAARDEAVKHAARMDTLYAQDVIALAQRDQAHLNVTAAESQVATAQAALNQVATARQYAVIRAPFQGSVVRRHVNPGDLAVPGMPLLEVTADGAREVVFGVPPELAATIEVGSQVAVDGGVFGWTDATVRAVSSGADARSRSIEVRAEVPASWPTGIAVTAFAPGGIRPAVTIPGSAVVRRGQLTGVRVLTEGGEMLRWVRLGRQVEVMGPDRVAETRVEVLSGLRAGERIVR